MNVDGNLPVNTPQTVKDQAGSSNTITNKSASLAVKSGLTPAATSATHTANKKPNTSGAAQEGQEDIASHATEDAKSMSTVMKQAGTTDQSFSADSAAARSREIYRDYAERREVISKAGREQALAEREMMLSPPRRAAAASSSPQPTPVRSYESPKLPPSKPLTPEQAREVELAKERTKSKLEQSGRQVTPTSRSEGNLELKKEKGSWFSRLFK